MIGLDLLYRFALTTGECGANSTTIDSSCLPHAAANSGTIDKVLAMVFGIAAATALLVIVIGGFRYIAAHGDPGATAQARNAIIYAVIGLVVSMAAFCALVSDLA
jgi:hypothetical protein